MGIEKTLETEPGINIFYEKNNGNPYLVFLHGTTVNHTFFKEIVEHFRKNGFGTIALDQRGDGNSSKPLRMRNYTIDRYTDDLEKILSSEHIDKATVIGHSSGGMVGLNFASEFPERTDAVVAMEASYNFKETLPDFWKTLYDPCIWLLRSYFTLDNIVTTGARRIGRVFSKNDEPMFSYLDCTTLKDKGDFPLTRDIYTRNPLRYVLAMHSLSISVMNWNIKDKLPTIKSPALIINGGDDQYITPELAAKPLHELIPGSKKPIIIPGAKHQYPLQEPDVVNRHIENFLKEIYPVSFAKQ